MEDWKTLIKFMKKAIKNDPENPKQIIEVIGTEFIRLIDANKSDQFFFRNVKGLSKGSLDRKDKSDKESKDKKERKRSKDKSNNDEKNHKRS